MSIFRFQYFSIAQSEEVFAVGTDGVLLGALCQCTEAKRILEVGTGTGLIALMMAQRNTFAEIIALDIQTNAIKLAKENFKQSPFRTRLIALEQDFKSFHFPQKFDCIVSNPPFFEPNISQKHAIARQRRTLDYDELIRKSSENLHKDGILSIIIPQEHIEGVLKCAKENHLHLYRKILIRGIKDGKIIRSILEFVFFETQPLIEEFIIESSPRKYSQQYLEATRDFHIFRNNKN